MIPSCDKLAGRTSGPARIKKNYPHKTSPLRAQLGRVARAFYSVSSTTRGPLAQRQIRSCMTAWRSAGPFAPRGRLIDRLRSLLSSSLVHLDRSGQISTRFAHSSSPQKRNNRTTSDRGESSRPMTNVRCDASLCALSPKSERHYACRGLVDRAVTAPTACSITHRPLARTSQREEKQLFTVKSC